MCAMWSGLSRFLPSQQVGKRSVVMMPSLHLRLGKAIVSGERWLKVSRQVYVNWRKRAASAKVLAAMSPMNMRKPYPPLSALKRKGKEEENREKEDGVLLA